MSIRAIPENLLFFLDVISKLSKYKSGLFDLKFQRFRDNQDTRVQGLSHVSLKRRRNQNLVTMKFNMINWALDTAITLTLFVVSSTSPLTLILYFTFMSCGTPTVYFMGIEENRKRAQDYFRSNMRIFIRSSRVSPAEESNLSTDQKKRRQSVNQEIYVDTPF